MPKVILDVDSVNDVLNHLSPRLYHDEVESYYLGDIIDYINNVKLDIAQANYFPPDEYDWEMKSICDFGEAMDYFNGNITLPEFEDPDEDKLMVILDEQGPLGGDKIGILNNTIRVYVSIIPDRNDNTLSYIVFYYFFPYQGKTFIRTGERFPGTAHTADWETITILIKNNDALNPLKYGMSQHRNTCWVSDPDKVNKHFPKDATNHDREAFYISRNVHSIYDHAGKTMIKKFGLPLSVDYHRGSNFVLKGGKPVLVYSANEQLATKIDQNAAKLLSWGHDWGFHVDRPAYSDNDDDVVEQETAVGKLTLSELR